MEEEVERHAIADCVLGGFGRVGEADRQIVSPSLGLPQSLHLP